jgi:hypothetical protein
MISPCNRIRNPLAQILWVSHNLPNEEEKAEQKMIGPSCVAASMASDSFCKAFSPSILHPPTFKNNPIYSTFSVSSILHYSILHVQAIRFIGEAPIRPSSQPLLHKPYESCLISNSQYRFPL